MQPLGENSCVIVTGPTCSGKSALALALAGRLDGVVINADAMQLYRELRIVTARPTEADEALVPHRLYGTRPAAMAGSVADWRRAALAELDAAWATGRLPILCGGTGLYLQALTAGLSEIPDPGMAARQEARELLARIGPAALHARLAEVDPGGAARLRPTDGQRLSRAWEVWRGTGRSIAAWAAEPGLPPASCRFAAIRLAPPRPALREAIAVRFDGMLAAGALDEVAALLRQGLPAALPAMRAHGVPELAAALQGRLELDQARSRAILAQGQYTKRQATWFAHHPLAPPERTLIIDKPMGSIEQQSESLIDLCISFVRRTVDCGDARA